MSFLGARDVLAIIWISTAIAAVMLAKPAIMFTAVLATPPVVLLQLLSAD